MARFLAWASWSPRSVVNVSLRRKSATGRPFSLKRVEELGDPVCAQAAGVARRVRVLELRVLIDPVETERLGGVLLVDQRDGLAVESPVVALDDEVLTGTVADEFCAVIREPEFGGERVPVMLPREPVRARRQPRLEDMGGVRAATGQVPLIAEPGEQQLRLVAGEHRPALIIRAEVAIGRGPAEALNDLAVADRLVTRLGPPGHLRIADCHGAGDRAAELPEHRVEIRRVTDSTALG